MGRQYKNPPLVEVACQFRFEPGAPWDWTVAARVYDKVKATYPKRQQVVVNVEPDEDEDAPSDPTRLRFVREDNAAYVSVGLNTLSVHCIESYPSWIEFQKMIAEALRAYVEVAEPKAFTDVSLRYINVVKLSGPKIRWDDYLTISPDIPRGALPSGGRLVLGAWVQHVDVVLEEDNAILGLRCGTLQERPDLLLDLECLNVEPELVSLDASAAWLQKAHDAIEQMFEACVTDAARASFDREEHDEQDKSL